MKLARSLPNSKWLFVAGLIVAAGLAWVFADAWLPAARQWAANVTASNANHPGSSHPDDDAGHSHEHAGHAGHADDLPTSLELSPQARRNIGLTDDKIQEVTLKSYSRKITVPGIVVERPGRTKVRVAAPMTSVVTGIYAAQGQTVESGELLFKLRLTHEDLVQAQAEFLSALGRLDVERREIDRLRSITSGIIANKVVLEREYEKEKLEAVLNANREALLLHGLSEEQIDRIARDRKLLRGLEVVVPLLHDDASIHDDSEAQHHHNVAETSTTETAGAMTGLNTQQFVLQELNVQKGQSVMAGDSLCVLADYSALYVEGRAFEQDAEKLVAAANADQKVTAYQEAGNGSPTLLEGLEIAWISNEVDTQSRALHFYVGLPNAIVRDAIRDGRPFLTWRFKPGQRMQLLVPVEEWQKKIVLPVDALAQEGPESFVFVQNGAHFERRAVHVEFRDQFHAVIANDGSLFPGEAVALTGAHQMQMALKNKAGGGVDPHAGHQH